MSDYDSIEEIDVNRDGAGLRIGVVAARFSADVTDGLLAGCTAELTKLGVRNADILIATVPGALELPLALQTMAESGDYDALIALGAVLLGVLIVVLLWRIRGWDPRWLKRWRHSTAEAGWRVGLNGAEIRDFIRLGR